MDGKYSENFLEKFIKQSFQFISYDILIKKIYYLFDKFQNKNQYLKKFLNLIKEFIYDKQENKIINFKLSDEILSKLNIQKNSNKLILNKNIKTTINKEKIISI